LKWPLCIDPQLQACIFIKKMCLDQRNDSHRIMIANDEKLTKELEMSIKTGKWFIIENLSEKLPPNLEYIIQPQIKKRGKTKIIKFEDREIEYDDEFKLIMITALQNPHYQPEVCVNVCLINFSITQVGLKEQMLSLTVSIERKELEEELMRLIENNARNEKKLQEKENDILETLKDSKSEKILDDDDLINKLSTTKEEANRIKRDYEIAREREEDIKVERQK